MAADRAEGDGSDPLLSALSEVLEATRVLQQALRDSEERTVRNLARLRSGDREIDWSTSCATFRTHWPGWRSTKPSID